MARPTAIATPITIIPSITSSIFCVPTLLSCYLMCVWYKNNIADDLEGAPPCHRQWMRFFSLCGLLCVQRAAEGSELTGAIENRNNGPVALG